MKTFTVTISDEEEKTLLGDMKSIQEWIDNAIHNKARQMIDHYVTESGQGSKFSSVEEKLGIVRGLTIETAVDRQARLEEEM